MKKYIKPSIVAINADMNTSFLVGSDVKGEFDGTLTPKADIRDFEDVINDLGGLDANGNLTFGWE